MALKEPKKPKKEPKLGARADEKLIIEVDNIFDGLDISK
jgi:hypothetical protein